MGECIQGKFRRKFLAYTRIMTDLTQSVKNLSDRILDSHYSGRKRKCMKGNSVLLCVTWTGYCQRVQRILSYLSNISRNDISFILKKQRYTKYMRNFKSLDWL